MVKIASDGVTDSADPRFLKVTLPITFVMLDLRPLTAKLWSMQRWAILALLSALVTLVLPSAYAQEADGKIGQRKIISQISPQYPELARRMQLEGLVRVEIVVAPNGKVKATNVIGGSPLLAKAATDALEKWRWAAGAEETKELVVLHFSPRQ